MHKITRGDCVWSWLAVGSYFLVGSNGKGYILVESS